MNVMKESLDVLLLFYVVQLRNVFGDMEILIETCLNIDVLGHHNNRGWAALFTFNLLLSVNLDYLHPMASK